MVIYFIAWWLRKFPHTVLETLLRTLPMLPVYNARICGTDWYVLNNDAREIHAASPTAQ